MDREIKIDNQEIDTLVAQVLELDKVSRVRPPRHFNHKRPIHKDAPCEICGQIPDTSIGPPLSFTPIIYPALGGPDAWGNWIASCASCSAIRHASDVLSMPELKDDLGQLNDDLLAKRQEVLLSSMNHLTRHSPKSKTYLIRDALKKRHAYPRFRCYAKQFKYSHGYLFFTSRFGDKQSKAIAKAIARYGFGAKHVEHKGVSVYVMSDEAFKQVVAELIERNAYVLAIGEQRVGFKVDDCWWITMNSVRKLRRRRWGLNEDKILPHRPKRYKENIMARKKRLAYLEKIEPELENEMLKYEIEKTKLRKQIFFGKIPKSSKRLEDVQEKIYELNERLLEIMNLRSSIRN